jgi:hypothetical protein
MTASDFHGKPQVPDTVKQLDADVVVEVLSRHAVNISEAADELGVASADLRRLLWARPQLVDAAAEIEERRLDLAEKNILEALKSDDPRRRDAASMFTLRNSARAKRRGWITSSVASVDMTVNANLPPRRIVFRWRDEDDDKRDAEAAEAERLRDEGEQVVSIGWGDPDGSKTIEHEANPEDSNTD